MNTIMVVEDQAIIREPIELALRKAGYQTIAASNGAEAIQRLAEHRPDLILLDIAMPVMDGLSFLKNIRSTAAGKDVVVIALTATGDKVHVLEAAQLGVRGYMLKSRFSLAELMTQIQKCIAVEPRPQDGAPVASAAGSMPDSDKRPTATPSSENRGTSAVASEDQLELSGTGSPEHQIDNSSNHEPQIDALRSLKPIISRSEMAAQIEDCGELKGFSPAVAEVLKLTGNARCSIEHVAKAISRDHAIALKMLKLANSAVYTRGEPVESILKAVLRIGLGQIRQAVLNIAVIERFSSAGKTGDGFVDSGQFWEHAIATGIISAEIAHTRSDKEADGAFTMGLLHDVGRMVYVDRLGEIYQQVLKTAADLQLPVEQVEHRMLCYTHADVMDRVFRTWKFSKEFINPIVFHHLSAGNIRKAAPQESVKIATLGLANRLAHAFMLGSSGNQTIYPTEDLCELLRLDGKVISRIEQIARDETDKMKFALLANSGQTNWPQLREVNRAALGEGEKFRPLYVSASPDIDACRIFCDQMTDWEEGASANVGVISLRNLRDRVPLTEEYRAKEAGQGLTNLPLLVISPGGKIMPENSLRAGRRVEALSIPFTVNRFIKAVNGLRS